MLKPDEPSPESPSPASEDEDSVTIIASQSVSYSWQGPPPQVLQQYERILPNAAEDTFREWLSSNAHQRELEKREADAFNYNFKWAAAYRLASIVVIIAGGLLAILLGEPAMGWFLGLSAALSYPVGSALLRVFGRRGRDENSSSDQSNDP
ncbi:MAG: DUF2335 domain-containing protein [Chloroflexi bacterium]|nr:DUF2335 domain-containing protein [Chloroflexota bacterium]